jgi:hypothetical protein
MTQPDWDDERLDAAFHARFDRPAPEALAHDIHVRIAGTAPARFGVPRIGQPWSLAAAAVVVVLVGAAMIVPAALSLPGTSAKPSALPSNAATAAPGASATPTEQALPGSVFGLPIVGVRDAIAVRDSGTDDREIAVHGWFTPAPPVSCGGDAVKTYDNPVVPHCPDELVWLSEEAGSYVHATGDRLETEPPKGPALNPDLDGLDQSWFPELPVPGVDGGSTPVDVVLVGHFDDRRAWRCFGAENACRDRFVVDSVAMVHGVSPNVAPVHQNTTKASSSAADVATIIGNEAPGSPILSMTVVDGPDGLVTFEPSLSDGQQGLIRQPTVWIVRVLESERVSTYLVVDGSDAIYEMNPIGEAILVGGTPPPAGTTEVPASWPPTGARVVTLTSEVGAGQPPVKVAIVDESGRLGGASETGTVDPSSQTLDQRIEAYPELAVSPGRVHLVWVGGICDKQITVTVARDVKTISFDMGPSVNCDSLGVERQLVLDFSGLLDVPSIKLVDTSTPAATPSQGSQETPGYDLACGPLAPDTCQVKAASVIAATPTQRVVSLAFSDECGSYRVTFDDGQWITGVIDCIPGASPG